MHWSHIPQCKIQKKKCAHFCSEWCTLEYGNGALWHILIRSIWRFVVTVTASSKPTGNRKHYNEVIMGAMASQITGLMIVYSTVYSGADQRKHRSSASLAFVRGIHRWPVNSPHKEPVMRKMFPFDDVIMKQLHIWKNTYHICQCWITCKYK